MLRININKFFFDNSGHSILELLVAMPLLSVLLVVLSTSFAFGVKNYVVLLSNWELQNQVKLPMERLVMDLDYAEKVEISADRLRIHCRKSDGQMGWVEYGMINENRPVISRNSQPLTGGSRLGDIRFYTFEYHIEDEKLVTFTIGAENMLTGKKFALQSAVWIAGKDILP